MSKRIASIKLENLSHHGDVEGFDYADPFGQPVEGFVLRHGDELLAYRNECPHWNIPMDLDVLYDADEDTLRCPFHGACFEPKEGMCTHGPVEGMSLQALYVERDETTGQAHVFLRGKLSLSF